MMSRSSRRLVAVLAMAGFLAGCTPRPHTPGHGQAATRNQPATVDRELPALESAAASEADEPSSDERVPVQQVRVRPRAVVGSHLWHPPEPDTEASGAAPISRPPVTVDAGSQPSGHYTVAAMVGQVNGQAIYADRVFEPIADQLSALSQSRPRSEFRMTAEHLIMGQLSQIVLGALILGEAERDLSAQERAGLGHMLTKQREELIRYWGQGSVAVAQQRLVEETGQNLDQTLEDIRKRLLVQRYQTQKLAHKINITRKDVERYYRDHHDQYNPPATRVLRVIRVTSKAAADKIAKQLQSGKPFTKVAASSLNRYRRDQGGLMSEKAVGDEVFGQPQLNQAMLELNTGEHSPRIKIGDAYWWVCVDSVENEPHRSLREVQLEIESLLRRQRSQILTQEYRQRLLSEGSYDPLGQMGEALVEIAMSRYAPSE